MEAVVFKSSMELPASKVRHAHVSSSLVCALWGTTAEINNRKEWWEGCFEDNASESFGIVVGTNVLLPPFAKFTVRGN